MIARNPDGPAEEAKGAGFFKTDLQYRSSTFWGKKPLTTVTGRRMDQLTPPGTDADGKVSGSHCSSAMRKSLGLTSYPKSILLCKELE